ncbi:MAG: F0F1 ATP synthase subunit B [Campylobacterota bacterium]
MQLKALLLLVTFSTFSFAAAAPLGESDFFYRVVNVAIFVGILYYLINDKVREFFKERTAKIAGRLDEVSQKLQASKQQRKDAQLELEKAKARSVEIVENAKKECQFIATKVEEQSDVDIKNLEKAFDEKLKLERSKVTKEVVNEIMEELLSEDIASIDQEKFIKLVQKKVA